MRATREASELHRLRQCARCGRYLEDLNAQCTQKSNDFEARQQLRAEELEAIQKAIEIISSPDVSGASGKHLALVRAAGELSEPAGLCHHRAAALSSVQKAYFHG